MALNFPNDPVDGEIYEQFYWDATAGIWRNRQIVAELDSLSDVEITEPSLNEIIAYDTVSGKWINQDSTSAGIATETYVLENSAPRLLEETTTRTANYTLALTDINKVVSMNGSSLTLTIPNNSSVAFPIGSVVNVYNLANTNVTVVGDSGVTVRNAGDLGEFGEVSLRKRGTDEWVLAGNVS